MKYAEGVLALAFLGTIVCIPALFAVGINALYTTHEQTSDTRQSFTICADMSRLVPPSMHYINGQPIKTEIVDCPYMRVYVDNWTSIDNKTQNTIMKNFASSGWVVSP